MPAKRRHALTEWGLEVATFCLRNNITKEELAEEAGVSPCTITKVSNGRRSGNKSKALVQAVMARYEPERYKVS